MKNNLQYNYTKEALIPKWVHIGLSNFHRAHQARVLHEGIINKKINIGLLVYDLEGQNKKPIKNLKKNNYDYHHIINYKNKESVTKIGSIIKCLNISKNNEDKILNDLVKFKIEILTLTITESGYHSIDDKLNLNSKDIISDLEKNTTKSIYSFLFKFLLLKKKYNQKKLEIISCDNLIKNSEKLESLFMQFCKIKNKNLSKWVNANVRFCNSMVDRITPVYDKEIRKKLQKKFNINDASYVLSEDYFQWVIANCKNQYLKKLQNSGVQFVNSVNDYQKMKNLMLNASHCSTSFLSCIYGNTYVYETFNNKIFINFISSFLDENVIPFLKKTNQLDYLDFKAKILSRFSNKKIKDQCIRTTHNGSDNLIQFIVPSLIKNFKNKNSLKKFALIYASWYIFLNYYNKKMIYDINLKSIDLKEDYHKFIKAEPYPGIVKYINNDFMFFFEKYIKLLKNKKIQNAIKDAT